jgi:creatinine amidohydrolase
VPFGVNTGQMDIKLCLNIHPSTQLKILEDLVEVLAQQNIHKLCIMNGHGGNEFKTFIRELSVKFPQTFICTFNWWDAIDLEAFFQDPGDHAGELETSMMMNLKPNLVLPLTEAGDGSSKSFKIKGMKEGWVKVQRKWSAISKDTGVGNPKQATEAKGKDFFNAVTQEIGRFLSDLAETDLHDLYENN